MSDDFGPLWQLEQNQKHHEALSVSFQRDAAKATARGDDAAFIAEQFRNAIELLKGKGVDAVVKTLEGAMKSYNDTVVSCQQEFRDYTDKATRAAANAMRYDRAVTSLRSALDAE